jgi:hypothetical protein
MSYLITIHRKTGGTDQHKDLTAPQADRIWDVLTREFAFMADKIIMSCNGEIMREWDRLRVSTTCDVAPAKSHPAPEYTGEW